MRFSYVDLFAGIGGFHAALDPLGGKCVFVSEIDASAANIYRDNWGKSRSVFDIRGDIKPLTEGRRMVVPEHDVLTAGFPCQPFSKSGKQGGVREDRGDLFSNILSVIDSRRPELVLLENVRNLVGPKHVADYKVMLRLMRDLGYAVSDSPTIISPHEIPPRLGGTPQHRERLFIGAIRIGTAKAKKLHAMEPLLTRKPFAKTDSWEWNIREYLKQNVSLSRSELHSLRISGDQKDAIHAWDQFLKRYRTQWNANLPGSPLWMDYWIPRKLYHIPSDTPDWKRKFIENNFKFYTDNAALIEDWRKEFGVGNFIPSYRKFEWQAQSTKDLYHCLIQFRPSGIRVKKPNYAPTFVAMSQTPVLGWSQRELSEREALLLQGFPPGFSFSDQRRATSLKQIGNAVHVGVAGLAFRALVRRALELEQPWVSSLDLRSLKLHELPAT